MYENTHFLQEHYSTVVRTQKTGQILTLHKEGAQQLVCGHRFYLCSQVDVSPYHQRCSPEPQDPAERTDQQDITPEHY